MTRGRRHHWGRDWQAEESLARGCREAAGRGWRGSRARGGGRDWVMGPAAYVSWVFLSDNIAPKFSTLKLQIFNISQFVWTGNLFTA